MATSNLQVVISAKDEASAKLKGVAGNANSAFSGMMTAVKTYGLAIAGATAAAVGFAVKSAADIEMMRTNLDTLTGSAEAGKKMFTELYDFAARTPFETADLVKASNTLLAFGIANEKVMPSIKMLGDVALGNKVKFDGLSLAYSQVQSTGRLMGQDLLQMINQGFNPLTIIAEKTGKSMADLKKEMEQGAISADMVTEAFEIATSEGGRFYQGMDKGSKTLQGTISTLQDAIGMMTRKMVGLSETGEIIEGGLFEKVKNGVDVVSKYLEKNTWITDLATNALNGMVAGLEWLYNWIIYVKDEMVKFFTENEIGIALAYTLKAVWDQLVQKAKEMWEIVMKNKDLYAEYAITIGVAVVGALVLLAAALTAIIVAFGKLIEWAGAARNALLEFANNVLSEWERFKADPWQYLKEATMRAWEDISEIIRKQANSILGYIEKITHIDMPEIAPARSPVMKANGGQLMAGQASIVGERGPEVFVPSTSGTVVPNGKVGSNISVNFYGNINNTSDASLDSIGRRLARQLELANMGI